MKRIGIFTVISTLASLAPAASPAMAQDLIWARQHGGQHEESRGVAVDNANNVYMTGSTTGYVGGLNIGEWDAFLIKYDDSGTLLWKRQVGTSLTDLAWGVAVDGAGSAYITGTTTGSLAGPNSGGVDAFLFKFDASGSPLWKRQLGSTGTESSRGVAVDGAGNVYICGSTTGNLARPNAGSWEAYLAKYDASGTLLWVDQFGTGADHGYGVDVDAAGNVYIAGDTNGSPGGQSAGSVDALLAKYDESGTRLWTRQIGTSSIDIAYGVAVDGEGNAYISGTTAGSLAAPNPRSIDAILAKYDAAGRLLWTRQLGTPEYDASWDVAGKSVV